ncbi:GNAT family N-acetyltransferase [Paracoccus liaowanqingii]|uniref:GNAT family N-acetyltransferase n=1 Tax=Paracoccus liaowanqingii TaxID=2560053 RepID=UPI001F0F5EBD|nr:GNAT family N-acetyltransferase [Paracoccus liaowanqingii]
MILRDAAPSDVPQIAAIWNPIVRDTAITFWPTERTEADIAALIAQRQAGGQAFLVAETDGVVGFGTYTQFRGGAGYARSQEHTIYLVPGQRGLGLGRTLLCGLEDHARARGHRVLIGGITGSNLGSIAFHAAMGYAQWGCIPAAGWKFGQFHDLVLMGRDLTAMRDTPPLSPDAVSG